MQIGLEPPYLVIRPDVTEEKFYRLSDEDSNWEYIGQARDALARIESPRGSFLFPANSDERVLGRKKAREGAGIMTPKRLEGPADMVIEIVSESDPTLDYRERLPRYREAGIDEIWIVDPFKKEVLVEKKTPSGYVSANRVTGLLDSSVISGFRINVDWLWQEELPSTFAVLKEMLWA